jgi:electron transport complex protein RnfE
MHHPTMRQTITDALWVNNNVFVQMLGMCPTLAVTTSVENGMGMGLATTFVLFGSNLVVSMVRFVIPSEIRIPAYIVIIAGFVTLIDLAMNAWFHALYQVLGIYIPLIVANCVVLGRAEAFANRNAVLLSAVDGFFTGIGFTLALMILGGVRELLGAGTLLGVPMLGSSFHPSLFFILPPGAFLALGMIIVLVRVINRKLGI